MLGAIAAYLALAVAALTSQNAQMVRAAYLAMELTARFVIVPLAFASLLTGFIQSLGTQWGLFRHYWVLMKLLLTVFATIVLLCQLEPIGHAASLAAETNLSRADIRVVGIQLVVHELCVNLGDGLFGIDQAASLRPASMPSVNLTPVISFGNWF